MDNEVRFQLQDIMSYNNNISTFSFLEIKNTINEDAVICPYCEKQRLFDASANSNGFIQIKCQRCGRVVDIDLKALHSEQIRA